MTKAKGTYKKKLLNVRGTFHCCFKSLCIIVAVIEQKILTMIVLHGNEEKSLECEKLFYDVFFHSVFAENVTTLFTIILLFTLSHTCF